MAKENEQKGPPMFRCNGVRQIGAAQDGQFGYVELFEVNGDPLALAFPATAATELANRIMAAGDMAQSQKAASNPGAGERPLPPAALVTEHTVVPAENGDTILMTLMAGPVPLMVRLSTSRSEKLRASLERCESQMAGTGGNDNSPASAP